MQADLGFHFDDANGDLDEAQTQGVELGGSEVRTPGHGGAQPPHQPVRSGVQEEAKLVGGCSCARGTVGSEVGLEGFDVVLSHPASAVDVLVECLRPAAFEVGDDESGVSTLRADLDAGDDALGSAPTGGCVEELLEAPDFARACLGAFD